MSKKNNLGADANQLVEDAQALLAATAHVADEKVAAARKRLSAAIDDGRDLLDEFQNKAIAGAKSVDEAIRENPYQAIGIALAAGALLAYFMRRRD